MSWQFVLALGVGALLAYANGANDVSKGVATLVGSGVADYRRALAWGTAWTALGCLLGATAGGTMLATFGHGLLTPDAAPSFAFGIATLAGAAAWVLIATRTGMPVSTTHAIVGSLAGVALSAYGAGAVQWSAWLPKVFGPLLLSPIASMLLTAVVLRATKQKAGAEPAPDCVCAELSPVVGAPALAGAGRHAGTVVAHRLVIVADRSEACATERPSAVRLRLDHVHWLTSGATSLARGMNDAPKIVALLLGATALSPQALASTGSLFGVTALAMVAGSALSGLRVTAVLAEKVTRIDHREGLSANLVTAGLVTTGAVFGLPMSTTHVASSGIFGAGALRGSLDLGVVRNIVLSWLVTLPLSAALSAGAYALARTAGL